MNKRRTTVINELNQQYGDMSWEEAVEQFLDSLKIKGLSYNTRRWHKENLQAVVKILRKLSFATEPALVTEKMLKEVILYMVDSGLSATTINHRVRSLKQFYEYLMFESLVGSDPSVKLDRKRKIGAPIETFTEEQLSILLAVPDKTRFKAKGEKVEGFLFLLRL